MCGWVWRSVQGTGRHQGREAESKSNAVAARDGHLGGRGDIPLALTIPWRRYFTASANPTGEGSNMPTGWKGCVGLGGGLCALLFTDQNWKLPYGRIQQAGMELEKCCAGAMLAALALALAIPVTAGVLAPGVLPYPKSEMGQVRVLYQLQ